MHAYDGEPTCVPEAIRYLIGPRCTPGFRKLIFGSINVASAKRRAVLSKSRGVAAVLQNVNLCVVVHRIRRPIGLLYGR